MLLAISAAADRGLPVVVVAVVVATVLTVAAALVPPGPGTWLSVAARATGALLVLASVLLVVDGVLAV